jgi:hypothetical protein
VEEAAEVTVEVIGMAAQAEEVEEEPPYLDIYVLIIAIFMIMRQNSLKPYRKMLAQEKLLEVLLFWLVPGARQVRIRIIHQVELEVTLL